MHHQKTPCFYIQRIAVVFQFEKQNKKNLHANTRKQNYSILHMKTAVFLSIRSALRLCIKAFQ